MYRKTFLSIIVIVMISVLMIGNVYAGVFRVVNKSGDWDTIGDKIIKSKYEIGKAYVYLAAYDYVLGGWFGSLDINLYTETGNNITGYIEVGVKELNISITYIESYIPGTYGLGDKISNTLIINVNGTKKIFKSSAVSPFDSRLNTRIYFSIENIGGNLSILVQDPYGKTGYKKQVFVDIKIPYDKTPVTLYIKVYKDSGNAKGRIECPLFINDVEDNKVFKKISIKTVDYGLNALFYLSMGFLVIAIAFNIIAGRIQKEYPSPAKEKGKKK